MNLSCVLMHQYNLTNSILSIWYSDDNFTMNQVMGYILEVAS